MTLEKFLTFLRFGFFVKKCHDNLAGVWDMVYENTHHNTWLDRHSLNLVFFPSLSEREQIREDRKSNQNDGFGGKYF